MDPALLTLAESLSIKRDAAGIKLNAADVAALNAKAGLPAKFGLMSEGQQQWVNPLTLAPLALLHSRDVAARAAVLQAQLESAKTDAKATDEAVAKLNAMLTPQVAALMAALNGQIAVTESLSKALLVAQDQHKALATKVEELTAAVEALKGQQTGLQGSNDAQFGNLMKFVDMFKDLTTQGPGSPGEVEAWVNVANEQALKETA